MSKTVAILLLLCVGGLTGIGYSTSLPPLGWGDEVPHFLRAYRIASGDLIAGGAAGTRSSAVPIEMSKLIRGAGLTATAWERCTLSPRDLRPLLALETSGAAGATVLMREFGAPYPPTASLHASPGVAAARRLSDRPLVWFYAARLSGFVVWLAACGLAIYVAPALRITLLAICLTPTALFLASTCSVDGILDAGAFLWTTWVLRAAQRNRPRPTARDTLVVLSFAVFLATVKLVYAPLILLLALVPLAKAPPLGRAWAVLLLGALALGGLATLGWIAVSGGTGTSGVVFGEDPGGALDPERILTHPLSALLAVPRTIAHEWHPWLINLAWPKYTACMPWHDVTVPIVWGSLGLALLSDAGAWCPTRRQRLVALTVFAAVLSVSILVAYATWTPADASRAHGVHARYFLPALPALAIAVIPTRTVGMRPWLAYASVVGMLTANTLVLVAFVRQYDWAG